MDRRTFLLIKLRAKQKARAAIEKHREAMAPTQQPQQQPQAQPMTPPPMTDMMNSEVDNGNPDQQLIGGNL